MNIKFLIHPEDNLNALAIFPDQPEGEGFVSGYAHIGQHCTVSKAYIEEAREASYPEFYSLLNELTNDVGYEGLTVKNKAFQFIHPGLNQHVSMNNPVIEDEGRNGQSEWMIELTDCNEEFRYDTKIEFIKDLHKLRFIQEVNENFRSYKNLGCFEAVSCFNDDPLQGKEVGNFIFLNPESIPWNWLKIHAQILWSRYELYFPITDWYSFAHFTEWWNDIICAPEIRGISLSHVS